MAAWLRIIVPELTGWKGKELSTCAVDDIQGAHMFTVYLSKTATIETGNPTTRRTTEIPEAITGRHRDWKGRTEQRNGPAAHRKGETDRTRPTSSRAEVGQPF